MGILDACKRLYQTDCFYSILKLDKNAPISEIRKAYHRISLQVHPDRVDESEKKEATEKFQTLGKIYSILSDKEKKAAYDETGSVDDEDFLAQDKDWEDYWRLMFTKVTEEDIARFEKEYKDSAEEKADIKKFYLEGKGDMDYIINHVLCARLDEDDRFRLIIQAMIESGELPRLDAFKESKRKRTARKRKAETEAKEAEELAEELGLKNAAKDEDALSKLILQRREDRAKEADSFLDGLAAKYGATSSAKTTKGKKSKLESDSDDLQASTPTAKSTNSKGKGKRGPHGRGKPKPRK